MDFTYSIGIFGTVSSGKSTLINSIFAKQLSQMNIRRTTMTPQVYIFDSESKKFDGHTHILTQNEEMNRKFQNEVWDGRTINEFHSLFPTDFLPRNPNLRFQLYDLPGLNDQSTSHIYMTWARANFHLFDCVILVIDVNSGLNTSDEINICELVLSKMAEKKHVNLIVLVNKCDEMEIQNGKHIICHQEREAIYNEQIIPTLDRLKQKFGIEESRCHIIKFCSRNAFIYRTIQHNNLTNARAHLDENHMNDMIQLELSRSEYLRLSASAKKNKINSLIERLKKDKQTYDENMQYSGFVNLREALNEVVNNPRIVQPFYEKIIREQIEKDKITREECFENLVIVNKLVLDDEFKAYLAQSIINFYVENFYNHYSFQIKATGQELYNQSVMAWFEDLKIFQSFEDFVNELPYIPRKSCIISFNFFEKLTTMFLEQIKKFSNDVMFINIVDKYIIESSKRYRSWYSKDYLDKLISGFIRPSYWNNRVFFDWAFSKGWKNKEGFIVSYITETFSIVSKENIFYLNKITNHLRDIMENVSIFCDMKRSELQYKMNFASITGEEMNSFNRYDEKYKDFLSYLIEKN